VEPQKTILTIDDDDGVRKTIQVYLARNHYRVVTASDGRQGLEVFTATKPDLVLTDLFMPEMDGFAVLNHITGIAPDTPVIVISGMGQLGDAIRALRMGAWDYIYKPIEEISFLGFTVEKALEKADLVCENRAYRERLEAMVAQKTAELEEKTQSLERMNIALKALLDQREIEKQSVETSMVANLKRFVFPYLDSLTTLALDKRAFSYVNIIRTNIEELIAPMSGRLPVIYQGFTPSEVAVADLIREGRSTKDISAFLRISPSTVAIHRNNIRKKLGLLNQKTNLQTHLNRMAK